MPDPSDLVIKTEKRANAVVVAPEGDIDLSRSPALRAALQSTLTRDRPRRLVIDLARVEYIDSSGVATIVEALKTAKRDGATLVLCSLQERVLSVFEIARLDHVFTIVPDVDAALAQ